MIQHDECHKLLQSQPPQTNNSDLECSGSFVLQFKCPNAPLHFFLDDLQNKLKTWWLTNVFKMYDKASLHTDIG